MGAAEPELLYVETIPSKINVYGHARTVTVISACYSKLKKVTQPSPAEDVEEPEPATKFSNNGGDSLMRAMYFRRIKTAEDQDDHRTTNLTVSSIYILIIHRHTCRLMS